MEFCYDLPQKLGMLIKLVGKTLLQMGWIKFPPYFCTVSKTGRDVAEKYTETPVVSLAQHKFVKLTEVNSEFTELPKKDTLNETFNYMLEVYMDNYIALYTPRIQYQLNHVANAIMPGIHDMLTLYKYDKEDAISLKKIIKK